MKNSTKKGFFSRIGGIFSPERVKTILKIIAIIKALEVAIEAFTAAYNGSGHGAINLGGGENEDS